MRVRKRTETVTETREVWVVRRARPPASVPCPSCPAATPMVEPEVAAQLAGVSTRTIYRLVGEDRLHFSEPRGGGLLVCLTSLAAARRR